MGDNARVANKSWDPEAQLNDLMLEMQFDDGNAAASSARMLREHALQAASSIAHLSAHAGNERVRMQASAYILDKVLNDSLDHDHRLHQELVTMVGSALASVVRALGVRYNFDPDSPEVKSIAHECMVALASAGQSDESEAA
jgi:hypothetical protein